MHFKMLSRSPFNLWVVLSSPIFFATLAYLLFRRQTNADLLMAALAAGVMGVWSSTGSGTGVLQMQRRLGVLELLVAAPAPFWAVLLPMILAVTSLGIYSLFASVAYVCLFFGAHLTIGNWPAFIVAVPVMIGSIGALGFLFSCALVRFRSAFMIGNAFEWPIWLVCGLLVPVHELPSWLRPLSWFLAPTWGMAALRHAVLHTDPWFDLAMCAVLAAIYLALGTVFLRLFLDSARRAAALSLW
jgi:ABC-2 type transport system permease protein